MKKNLFSKPFFNGGSLFKAIFIIILGFASTAPNANEYDQRQVLPLTQAQQAHVLTEMRSLLTGIQGVVSALVTDDMDAVAKHARPLGMGMKQKPEKQLHSVLPKAFKMQGKSIHMTFDSIADDAEKMKDPKHTLKQVSEILQKCQGCHESYRIEISNASSTGNKHGREHGDGVGHMKHEKLQIHQKEENL